MASVNMLDLVNNYMDSDSTPKQRQPSAGRRR